MRDVKVPFDEQMEKIALAAMLAFPTDLLAARDLLQLGDFYLDSNRRIFGAMVRMSVSRKMNSVDLVTLSEWMTSEGTLQGVGGVAYLASLDEVMPVRGSVKTYAESLRALSNRRALISAVTSCGVSAEGGESTDSIIANLEMAIAQIRAEGNDGLITASEAVDRVNASLKPETRLAPLSTGITGLDNKTLGGIRLGELWTLGALPGRGKSSAARQIALHVARKGSPTMVCSLEMTIEQWFGLDQATTAKIEPWKIRESHYLTDVQREQIASAGEDMRSLPIYFDESSQIHIDRIVAKARIAVMQRGIKLLVVDYIQRVDGNGRELRNKIGDVAAKLAAFAKDSKVAVLLLSQLKRPSDINTRPTLVDLKESGDIEAHSHTVILSYRPVDRETEKPTGDDELIVAKQRFGPIGTIPIAFDGEWLRFKDRSPHLVQTGR